MRISPRQFHTTTTSVRKYRNRDYEPGIEELDNTTVSRAYGVQSRKAETFKFSTDP